MKRFISTLLLFCLILSGCAPFAPRLQEPVTFYYVHGSYQQTMEQVIVPEEREAAGHRSELSYMMALYLMGPTKEESVSPIPRGTRVIRAEILDSGVDLLLSDTAETMTDAQYTLACACLALTCMDLTEKTSVTITSGARSLTMTEQTLLQWDQGGAAETEETK